LTMGPYTSQINEIIIMQFKAIVNNFSKII